MSRFKIRWIELLIMIIKFYPIFCDTVSFYIYTKETDKIQGLYLLVYITLTNLVSFNTSQSAPETQQNSNLTTLIKIPFKNSFQNLAIEYLFISF